MGAIHIVLGAPKEEAIKPLLVEEGLVVGVDRGAIFALEEEIEVNIALGDFDSVTAIEKKYVEENVDELVSLPTQKNNTDAEMALVYVLENLEAENIYFYNWYGGRVDHLYSLLLFALQDRFKPLVPKINFVASTNNISYYLPGKYEIQKNKEMHYLSYILLTEVKELTIQEVKYPIEAEDFNHPVALVSNEFLEKRACFSFSEGIIAVVQSRD